MGEGDGWTTFEPGWPEPAAALIEQLPIDDGDSVVMIEPQPVRSEKRGLFARKGPQQSPASVSIMKRSGSHDYLLYLSFPKEIKLTELVTLPDDFTVESEGAGDATLTAPLQTAPISVARCAITCLTPAVEGSESVPWRTILTWP